MENLTKEKIDQEIKSSNKFMIIFRIFSIINLLSSINLVINGDKGSFLLVFCILMSVGSFYMSYREDEDINFLKKFKEFWFFN